MKKRLLLLLALIVGLLALAVPTVVFAHEQATSPTIFYACEASATTTGVQAGQIDGASITEDSTLTCPRTGGAQDFDTPVQWNAQGTSGDPGNPGTNGSSVLTSSDVPTGACTTGDTDIDLSNGEVFSCVAASWTDTGHTVKGDKGDKGDTGTPGAPGIPFTHAACTETQTGSAQQENLVFCISGIEDDGGPVYLAAIAAAKVRVLVGTPLSTTSSVDWNNQPITYVEFTSAYHAEYHTTGDTIVRIYNALNQRVF